MDISNTVVCTFQIALTTIRRLATRVHPLISVNYFAWAVAVVTAVLNVIERIPWPMTVRDWSLLVVVGIVGSLMVGAQFPELILCLSEPGR